MKITPIKQRDEIACGPASIQMVLDYFKLPYSWGQIAEISQYKKKDGLCNVDLVNTLKVLKLNVKEKANSKWEDLLNLNTLNNVIIVSWMKLGYKGHFSVVEQVNKDSIELADPDNGKIVKIDKIKFMCLWMDYDGMWYPARNTDIQLRWMCIVSLK